MTVVDKIAQNIDAYDVLADELIPRYESLKFEAVHQDLLPWLPPVPASVLDVGSGTGRDSKALAEMGYEVVSVEPSEKMLAWAKKQNSHKNISWIQDSLPELQEVQALNKKFDLILVSAVIMHLSEDELAKSLETISYMLNDTGVAYISTSSGTPNDLRRFRYIDADELNKLANNYSLRQVEQKESNDRFGRSNIIWLVSIYKKH